MPQDSLRELTARFFVFHISFFYGKIETFKYKKIGNYIQNYPNFRAVFVS